MRQFIFRVLGAATLDARVYEDVETDRGATGQAIGVIALASVAAGFGARGWNADPKSILEFSAVVGALSLLAWVSWAGPDARDRWAGAARTADASRYWRTARAPSASRRRLDSARCSPRLARRRRCSRSRWSG